MAVQVNQFLNSQLSKIAKDEGFIDYRIEISSESFQKYGFTTLLRRLTIIGSKKDVPDTKLNLICKTYPENAYSINVLNLAKIFEREVYIYTKVLPEFSNFQRKKGFTSNGNGFFNFPKVYFAVNDHESKNYFLILEDLSDKSYKVNTIENGLDYHHFKVTVEEIAKFHALSYAIRDQKPELFKEIRSNTIDQFVDHQAKSGINESFLNQCLTIAFEELSKVEKPDSLILKNVKNLYDNLLTILRECVSIDVAEPFGVLNHGDLHLKNLMFKCNDNGIPINVKFIDWQLSFFGSPALDLSLFLFTLTSNDFRDKYYNKLITYYYEALANFIEQLGSKTDQLISLSEICNQMRKFGKFGCLCSLSLHLESQFSQDFLEQFFNKLNHGIMDKVKHEINLSSKTRKLITETIRDGFERYYF